MKFPALVLVAFVVAMPTIAQQPVPAQPVRDVRPLADPLNLDFERPGLISPDSPDGWYGGGAGYSVARDSTVAHSGTWSLRIRPTGAVPPNGFGVTSMVIPGQVTAGKTVHLRGYIRTEAIASGYAGLWMRVDGKNGRMLTLDNMGGRGATGTTGWTAYELSMHADTSAGMVIVGALHPGDGTAWFDSFAIDIDGVPYDGAAAVGWKASAAELAYVRDHAIRLTTSDPAAPLDDLRPVGALVGDASIVALGEGTHGTSEFFQMKHRLTRYLATEKRFTVFAIEANMPEARRVNEYVLTGKGDPRAALAGMYFWTWNTQEVLDMIEWMRAYNASGKGRMEFWGFDLQTPTVAMDSVRAFLYRADASFAAAADSAYVPVHDALMQTQRGQRNAVTLNAWQAGARGVLDHIESHRAAYVAAGHDTMEVAWAIQNARIVVQGAGSTLSAASRDSSMAANVAWIRMHQPAGTRMVLWAHNGHVNRAPGWMGSHLADRYGSEMRVFGFALGDGSYTAVGPRGLSSYPAAPPAAGSVEEVFRSTGIPRFIIDLRGAATVPAAAWLAAPHDFRSIGAMALDRAFAETPVADRFDALIYFDHTTHSVPLPARTVP